MALGDIGDAGKRILLGLNDGPPFGIEKSALSKCLSAEISGRRRVTDHLFAARDGLRKFV